DMPGPVGVPSEPGLRLTKTLPGGATEPQPADFTAPLVTAMADRKGFDVLRPSPQSARLAYIMVVSTLDG
ncbi:MAG: hypothetical protein ACREB5_03640, partial [Sphingomonadaceae bacterium]